MASSKLLKERIESIQETRLSRLTGRVACLRNKCVRKFILNVFSKVPVNRKCIRKCVYVAQSF